MQIVCVYNQTVDLVNQMLKRRGKDEKGRSDRIVMGDYVNDVGVKEIKNNNNEINNNNNEIKNNNNEINNDKNEINNNNTNNNNSNSSSSPRNKSPPIALTIDKSQGIDK